MDPKRVCWIAKLPRHCFFTGSPIFDTTFIENGCFMGDFAGITDNFTIPVSWSKLLANWERSGWKIGKMRWGCVSVWIVACVVSFVQIRSFFLMFEEMVQAGPLPKQNRVTTPINRIWPPSAHLRPSKGGYNATCNWYGPTLYCELLKLHLVPMKCHI